MRKIFFITVFFAAVAALHAQEFSTSTMRSITIKEAYGLALARSENLAMMKEGIKQFEQEESVIRAAFRPSFEFTASRYKEQNASSVSRGYVSGSYNLFSGMRDYISARAASAKTVSAGMELERAKQNLFMDTASAYLNLIHAQNQVFIRMEQIEVDNKRIAELQARASIGRSRISELVAAKTQLAQDKASLLEALLNERIAQRLMQFLTGLDSDTAPAKIKTEKNESLEFFLGQALARPDITAKKKILEYSEHLLEIQERNAWPSVDLSADYYVLRRPEPSPENNWNAGITLKVPIYSGGVLKAGKESALSARKSAELALELARRQAEYQVKSAYEEFKYNALQVESLEQAISLARENAVRQREDYKLGLVTNLDVISALNTVVQTRLALSRAKLQEKLSCIKLKTAAGMEME